MSAPSKLILMVLTAVLMLPVGTADSADAATRQQQMAEIRKKMAMANILVRTGKKEDAATIARTLFPSGPPGGELGLEYYRIIGNTPSGWSEAKTGLEKLVKAEPYVMLYQRELAKHLLTRESTRAEGVRILAEMAKKPDADKALTLEAWRGTFATLGDNPADIRQLQAYLAVDASNQTIRDRLVKAQQSEAKRRQASEFSVSLENLEVASATLEEKLQKHANDLQLVGDLGLVRLRQGRHAEANVLFERALALDPSNRNKWKSLIATATFWQLMRESSVARDEKNFDLAENKARAALQIEANNADGIALVGSIFADRGNFSEAEKLYRESIKLDPGNGSAIRGLVNLMKNQGRRAEAIALLDSLGDPRSEASVKYASLRAGILRDEADTFLASGRIAEAEAMFKNALLLTPTNPWAHFDLARLYQMQGSLAQSRALMNNGLLIAPNDPQMLHANALFLASLDEPDNALLLLEKIPPIERTPSMLSLQQRMGIQSQTLKAATASKNGRHNDAVAILAHAEIDAGNDPEFVNSVANAWMAIIEPTRALALIRNLLSRQSPPSVGLRLRYASFLNRTEQDAELSALLQQLTVLSGLSVENQKDLRYLISSLSIRRADKLRKQGDFAAARETLIPILQQDAENSALLMALARVHIAAQEPAQARSVYQRILDHFPNDIDAQLALIKVMYETGEQLAARKRIDLILAATAKDDFATRLDIADQLIDMNDLATARQIADQLPATTAENKAHVLILFGRIAKADGHYNEAMGYFIRAKATENMSAGNLVPAQPTLTEADEEIARLEQRRNGYIATGYDIRSKKGTAGVSAFTVTELPFDVHLPLAYSGHALLHIDPVIANAGNLPLDDLFNLSQYGKIQALAPAGIASAPNQNAKGVAVAIGYETDNMRVDIGTTPLGFPVQDIVGGIKINGSLSPFYYSLNLARRPVTSSLVSYAGARDPVSGEVWGGVRSIGTDLSAGFERGRFDTFANVGYHLLTGKNVLANTQLEFRTGINWEFIRQENMRLSAGLAITNWRYRENLSHYTFGQGGYYSPQNYRSLALPWRWSGRNGSWSYLLKGSVSTSNSDVKDMPYYPTDGALQAAAGNPIFTGGKGRGNGYSMGGSLEYRIAKNLFIGGRFEIDRSEFYTPNFATVYLRYMFSPRSEAVPYPPDPAKPYSKY